MNEASDLLFCLSGVLIFSTSISSLGRLYSQVVIAYLLRRQLKDFCAIAGLPEKKNYPKKPSSEFFAGEKLKAEWDVNVRASFVVLWFVGGLLALGILFSEGKTGADQVQEGVQEINQLLVASGAPGSVQVSPAPPKPEEGVEEDLVQKAIRAVRGYPLGGFLGTLAWYAFGRYYQYQVDTKAHAAYPDDFPPPL